MAIERADAFARRYSPLSNLVFRPGRQNRLSVRGKKEPPIPQVSFNSRLFLPTPHVPNNDVPLWVEDSQSVPACRIRERATERIHLDGYFAWDEHFFKTVQVPYLQSSRRRSHREQVSGG